MRFKINIHALKINYNDNIYDLNSKTFELIKIKLLRKNDGMATKKCYEFNLKLNCISANKKVKHK